MPTPPDQALSDKAALHRAALARRDALGAEPRERASEAIGRAPLPFDPRLAGLIVGGYWPIRSEVDPRPLMRRLAGRGARLALPVVGPSRLTFRAFAFGDALEIAGFGLSEPLPAAPEVVPGALLVPLAAFDRTGQRIGYGRGYYDRAIAALDAHAPPLTVGLAFAVQEIARVPAAPHDRPLDWVLTEREAIACGGGR